MVRPYHGTDPANPCSVAHPSLIRNLEDSHEPETLGRPRHRGCDRCGWLPARNQHLHDDAFPDDASFELELVLDVAEHHTAAEQQLEQQHRDAVDAEPL